VIRASGPSRGASARPPAWWGVWLATRLRELVTGSPLNRLEDYGGQSIFQDPLVGIADGDDPMFGRFREVVSRRHLMPRDVLARQRPSPARSGVVRVVAWAMPFTVEVRRSNRDSEWPSELYSLARNNGGALSYAVHAALVGELSAAGWAAAAPCFDEGYDVFRSPEHEFSSTWSERHVAFAAGLGRFGLNGALMTAAGIHVRLGSIVTDLPVDVTSGSRGDHRASCLRTGAETCDKCIARCPRNAISSAGLDKTRCHARRREVRERFLADYQARLRLLPSPLVKNGTRVPGFSIGCALCQCGVPCDAAMPDWEGTSCST
jgi:epoxyqueuosine reductase